MGIDSAQFFRYPQNQFKIEGERMYRYYCQVQCFSFNKACARIQNEIICISKQIGVCKVLQVMTLHNNAGRAPQSIRSCREITSKNCQIGLTRFIQSLIRGRKIEYLEDGVVQAECSQSNLTEIYAVYPSIYYSTTLYFH